MISYKEDPRTSIVVVNAKTLKFLKDALISIIKNTKYENYEIVVVDCLSPDFEKWMKQLGKQFPRAELKYKHYLFDLGASASHNKALELIDPSSEYVIFLDSDVKAIQKDWIKKLLKPIHSSNVAAVSPVMTKTDDPKEIAVNGYYLLPHMQIFEIKAPYEVPRTDTYETSVVSGAAFIIRKEILDELSRFGLPVYYDFFFIGHDDVDLSIRLQLRGYKVLITRNSVISHRGEATTKHLSPFRAFHGWKNIFSIIIINYRQVSTLLKVLSSAIIWQLLFLTRNRRNLSVVSRVLKADVWVLRNVRQLLTFRSKVNRYRTINDNQLVSKLYRVVVENGVRLLDAKARYGRTYTHYLWSMLNKSEK